MREITEKERLKGKRHREGEKGGKEMETDFDTLIFQTIVIRKKETPEF